MAETLRAGSNWAGVEAGVWTERMLSALGNGVKGGKWYSMIDKVYACSRFTRPGNQRDLAWRARPAQVD